MRLALAWHDRLEQMQKPARRFRALLWCAAVSVFVCPWLPAAGIEAHVAPDPVMVGEVGNFQIVSDVAVPQPAALPRVQGLDWLGEPQVSQSLRFVNFRKSVTASATYQFRVSHEGSYTIPAFAVDVDGKRLLTPPTTFRAEPGQVAGGAEKISSMDDVLFMELRVGKSGKAPGRVFVGQEIPLEIRVHVYEQLYRGMNYPEVRGENATLVENPDANRENPRFEPPFVLREIKNGAAFKVVVLRCRLTPLVTGPLKGQVVASVQLAAPERPRARPSNDPYSGFDPSFFDDFFAARQGIVRQVTADIPEIQVLPLPPVPADSGLFLGITGTWNLNLKVIPAAVPLGDPVTLRLEISGKGGIDALAAQKLTLPNFRVFDPEVKKTVTAEGGRATLTWVTVPLFADAALPKLTFCTFDPETERYQTASFQPTVKVLPAQSGSPGLIVDNGQEVPSAVTAIEPAARNANDILYVKKNLGSFVARPLWQNTFVSVVALLLAGPLAGLGLMLAAGRRERLSGSVSYRRRMQALRARRQILRELRNCPAAQRSAVICERLVPCLSALLDLPPGTTADALASRLEAAQPDLAAALRQAGEGDFRPGASTAEIDPARVVKAVKRLGLVLLACVALPFALGSSASAATGAPPNTLGAATDAYDHGQVEKALDLYRSLALPGRENPNLLYNEGNCEFRLGHLGDAVALYERARRLAPRDSDIRENLNFVRARLGLAPVGSVDTPRGLAIRLRDSLRPDEWALLAAVIVATGSVTAGWRRWRRRSSWPVLATTALAALAALLILWNQGETSYAPDIQGLIRRENTPAYRLPDSTSEKAQLVLRQGEPVTVTENRAEWRRVRTGEVEVWVPAGAVGTVW